MSAYRLHIDIPLPMSEVDAIAVTETVLAVLQSPHLLQGLQSRGVPSLNYRLGHDEDRQRSNYLQKTPSGHVTCNKNRIALDTVGETP
jgi:hypothetical protein